MDTFKEIHEARRAIAAAEDQLITAVTRAHDEGKTWAQIGAELGMTRQAAFKRFGKVTDPRTGELMSPRPIDSLPQLAEKFIEHVSRNEEEAGTGMLSHSIRKDLPWSSIMDTWSTMLAETGALQNTGPVDLTHPKGSKESTNPLGLLTGKVLGTVIAVVPLHHEAGEWVARIAFDKHDAIIGVLFLDPDDDNPQF
ncbi:hypothetical protein [Corynebacterium freneyi]|uniref:hypothetical protein n=1 Tax=Corynebacterium freneyi TaxID=134034 RepID=UPI0006925B7B|nr:hypothetical protein [Corynebacterium freneyi]